jgi:[protein-PII] uridylyltransferase
VTAPAERVRIVDDASVTGRAACRALAEATDVWLRELFEVAHQQAPQARVALIAVGGFGRGELAPYSDLDVLLVHDGKASAVEGVASAIWYPVWDAGVKLGHAVRSVDDTLSLASDDLDTATSLLTARASPATPRSRRR